MTTDRSDGLPDTGHTQPETGHTQPEAPRGVDLAALRHFLDEHSLDDHGLDDRLPSATRGPGRGALSARLLTGGLSNLTYELSDGSTSWVLRRPPLGHVLATAHDMGREYRVISALEGSGVPVPRPLLYCPDTEVIGAPFYLMEKVHGVVYATGEHTARLSPEQARQASETLVDVLARLHAVDYTSVGLADFGRPEGYLARQLERWQRQYAASASRDLPALAELERRLRDGVPHVTLRAGSGGGSGGSILHGDYRLDNVMFPPGTHESIAAVLDWEMATLGDPLADLALLLTYWNEPGSGPVATGLKGDLTSAPGFLTRAEIVERYVHRTGADVTHIDWYVAFSHYKIAVIAEGIYRRHQQGLTYGSGSEAARSFEAVEAAVPAMLDHALSLARASATPGRSG